MTLLLASLALAADPIVAAGNGLVTAPPEGFVSPTAAGSTTWVSVVADCLEEAATGVYSVVDRSETGVSSAKLATDVAAIRELSPAAVVIGVGANELSEGADLEALVGRVGGVVSGLRADGGPAVFLVGLVAPTMSQLDWKDDADLAARQEAVDAQTATWNAALEKVAASDDGVWMVPLRWPAETKQRRRLTRGGWGLTDRAHAHIGAVICEEILKNLKNSGE